MYLAVLPTKKWQFLDYSWSHYFHPLFTADGSGVIYMPETPARSVVRRALDSGQKQVLYTPPSGWRIVTGEVSPDDKWLAVLENEEQPTAAQPGRITLVDLNSKTTREVWSGYGLGVTTPFWSPDSTRAVWSEPVGSNSRDNQLHILDLASEKTHPLQQGLDGVSSGSWSPDLHRFAAFSIGLENAGVYVVDANSGQADRLVPMNFEEFDFIGGCPWSHDGKWIAFATVTSNSGDHLFSLKVVSPETKQVRTLLEPSSGVITALTWTPHGKLLFVRGGTSVEVVSVP
jgi:Tol biopolymer transport system component